MIKNIQPSEFKSYIKDFRACKFVESCEIEQKQGRLTIDLSEFSTINKCILSIRRKSGNGQLTIISNELTEEKRVVSRLGQNFHINVGGTRLIELHRSTNSMGIIELFNIDIEYDGENLLKWKNILNTCKTHKCIRIANDRLFASEGAFIEADNILNISTIPPNMYKITDKTVKFLGTCEITELNIDSSKENVPDLYQHIGPPPTIATPILLNHNTIKKNNDAQISQTTIRKTYVYESISSNLFASAIKTDAEFNGKSIILGHKGSLTVPIAGIKPNTNYVVSIMAQSMDTGNGKISACIIPNDNEIAPVKYTSQLHHALDMNIKSGSIPTNESFKLVINRSESATGSIAISKVILSEIQNTHFDWKKAIAFSPMSTDSVTVAKSTNSILKDVVCLSSLAPVPLKNNIYLEPVKERKFVIVIPSYNNASWVENNLLSALNQKYNNYRTIYIDDCSSDNTCVLAGNIINKNDNIRAILVKNKHRVGALCNLYNVIHSCADDEIILTLDGDDWLANENVLSYLNDVYKDGNIWMTYGQYKNYPDGATGVAEKIPNNIINTNGYRKYRWCATHLRTFYAWLFKNIKKEDLCDGGGFYKMAWDLALQMPNLEMAGVHSKFISDILYIYNMSNPINDHKVNRRLQADLDRKIRNNKKYSPISIAKEKPNNEGKINVGLIVIATNKYKQFVIPLISSADRYFLNNDKYNVSYFVFSDDKSDVASEREIKQIHIDHVPFPYATMNRYKYFTENKEIFNEMHYIYYVDVDCLFVNHVGEEILGDLTAVKHCGYYNDVSSGTFENNTKSTLFRPQSNYKNYYGGGFQGGKKYNYLALSKWCYENIEIDLSNNIIPRYHDESSLNTYLSENQPTNILSPAFHYPQNIQYFKPLWKGEDFNPIILLLEKNHEQARK